MSLKKNKIMIDVINMVGPIIVGYFLMASVFDTLDMNEWGEKAAYQYLGACLVWLIMQILMPSIDAEDERRRKEKDDE